MQWIIENQELVITILVSGIFSAFIVGWWIKQKYQFQIQLLKQQAEADQNLLSSKNEQLEQSIQRTQTELEQLDIDRDKAAHELTQTHGQLMAAMENLRHFDSVKKERLRFSQLLELAREEISQRKAELREQQARHQEESKAVHEKVELLEKAELRLKQEFEQLANNLFDAKTAKVDQQNKQSLEGLLTPLKEQLEGFKKQVTDSYGMEAKERHTLVHEIKSLQKLNEQMTKEAVNLTQALKGDNKQQGNWGEVVLARVLAESGLREGHEYQTQVSLQDDAGKRYQPDVIVYLPHEKQVIVDSKMALVAYERYFNAESDADKQQAISDHLSALRGHIKGLSLKDYQHLKGIQSLDYVLMFIPVEPAFQVAIEADPSLVKDAMENNIILVSPTTLLVALRTIDNLWRNERQNQNAKVIADRASKLYDKLRLFVTDMESVGQSLDKANQNYQGAMSKLATGRGNVIRQAESFKELGVEVKRSIPTSIIELEQNCLTEASAKERHQAEDKVN
ncbi:DNA recombination protein RmuC [Vibrio sp. DW001]|uniref:DNA recombination protein RmuC n=1 Tax=Vibrio sp. DW001 TaxID=2912315 RepID=UPI0023AF968F|nr:DNA recombination protein RmuC [Vibrio sp. DW001]WED26775.1 DNA recombination protein RmuC [Vibrio sp. DW001]